MSALVHRLPEETPGRCDHGGETVRRNRADRPGASTDVLVRGRPNALQVAGKDGGTKLLEIRRLAAQGHRVTIIGEEQFWRLVTRKPTRREANKR